MTDKIAELLYAGLTSRQIKRKLHIGSVRITAVRRDLGMPTVKSHDWLGVEKRRTMQRLIRGGFTNLFIARQVGVDPNTVRALRNRINGSLEAV